MAETLAREKCPFSLKETENRLPFDLYAEMRAGPPVQWDAAMGGWVVTTYAGCREVFLNDKIRFRHPDGDSDGDYAAISNGRRAIKTLQGEEHLRLHNWLLKSFSARETSAMMEDFARSVVALAIQNLAGKHKANLLTDFVDRIPVRVIAAAMELPWRDDAFIDRAQFNLNRLADFFNRRMAVTAEISEAAQRATEDMRALLDPFIEGRRSGEGSDLISRLWRDGPGMVSDWTAEDCFVHLNTVFLGGFDTSTLAISNALYLLLKNPAQANELRQAGPAAVSKFTEEVLRLYPPIHYRARRANEDTEIAGFPIRKDDFVIPLIGSANRDESRYAKAQTVDLTRTGGRDHLTFIAGPRACVGAGLARAEISEAVNAFIHAFPDAMLDPQATEPSYLGFAMRRFEPINIQLTA